MRTGLWPIIAVLVGLDVSRALAEITFVHVSATEFPSVTGRFVVRAGRGRSVTGLGLCDVRARVDGSPARITTLRSASEGGSRLHVAVVLDSSGSMRCDYYVAATKALADLASRCSEQDRITVVTISGAPRIAWTGSPADREGLARALRQPSTGWTPLYDGVVVGLQTLQESTEDRLALVVLSDGKDTGSRIGWAALRDEALTSGIPLYFIRTGERRSPLTSLAVRTGGRELKVWRSADFGVLYRAVSEGVASIYTANILAEGASRGVAHRLELESSAPGGRLRGCIDLVSGPGQDVVAFPGAMASPPWVVPALAGFGAMDILLGLAMARRRARR